MRKATSVLCAALLAISCTTDPVRPKSTAKVVPHEKLLGLLPALPGWTRQAPQTSPDVQEAVSRVQVDYENGISGLSIEIMDTTMNADVLGPMTEFIKAGRTDSSPSGTKRVTAVAEYPGTEEWSAEVGNGVVSILVADPLLTARPLSSVRLPLIAPKPPATTPSETTRGVPARTFALAC